MTVITKQFRDNAPKRTCTESYKNYRKYKPYLRSDFFNRCGYTNCSDFWFGGSNNFHIDHFKPYKKNPELETKYSNLVYCCSYVNILKSDDEGDYIDPCDIDFNAHFERSTSGAIIPKDTSTSAKYMFSKLKLGLERYRIIWMLDELNDRLELLENEIRNTTNQVKVTELRIMHSELSEEFRSYLSYLKAKQ